MQEIGVFSRPNRPVSPQFTVYRLVRAAISITALMLAAAAPGAAQRIITTIAGTDYAFPEMPMPALSAPVGEAFDVASGSDGSRYIANTAGIFRIDSRGTLTRVAGNGLNEYHSGPDLNGAIATRVAMLTYAIATAPDGSVYFTDSQSIIYRLTAAGTLQHIAGAASGSFTEGGLATGTEFSSIEAMAFDAAGSLYVADGYGCNCVRRITPDGRIFHVAGNGQEASTGDGGPAKQASLNWPAGVAVDRSGNVYISELSGGRVRKVDPQGIITTFAGGSSKAFVEGALATDFNLEYPGWLAVGPNGTVYVSDGILFAIGADQHTHVAASPASAFAVEDSGDLVFWDYLARRLKCLSADASVEVVAGNGDFRNTGDGGPATSATFDARQIAVEPDGTLWITSFGAGERVRRIRKDGIIETVAGGGSSPPCDGSDICTLAAGARLTDFQLWPLRISADPHGGILFAESFFGLLRIDAAGHATQAPLPQIRAISFYEESPEAIDAAGNVYISRFHQIVRVSPDGRRTVLAGSSTKGFTGDNGPATAALLNDPWDIVFDAAGNLYFNDHGNSRIRRVTPAGIITTIAGNGNDDIAPDGSLAASSPIGQAVDLTIDAAGNLYFFSKWSVLLQISPNGVLTTLAGGATRSDATLRDGVPGPEMAFDFAWHQGTDARGTLFMLDKGGARIRELLLDAPKYDVSVTSLHFSANSGGAPTPEQTITIDSPIPGLPFQISKTASWLRASAASGDMPLLVSVSADPANVAPGSYSTTLIVSAAYAAQSIRQIDVVFDVGPALPASLHADRDQLTFGLPRTAKRQQQRLELSNAGGGALTFTAGTSASSGGAWLSVSPPGGQVTPGHPVTLAVAADPAGLAPGTYSGAIRVNDLAIPVTLTISAREQAILLSQTGLSFTAVADGGAVPPQKFGVLNPGNGVLHWSARASTLAGGDWLGVSSASGATDADSSLVPNIEARIDQSRLAPGRYYGLVEVTSPEAANSPQVVSVFLEVLPAGSNPGSVLSPAELTFYSPSGFFESQDVLVYNLSGAALTYRTPFLTWQFQFTPTNSVVNPAKPTRITIQPRNWVQILGAASQPLSLQFSDGRIRTVTVNMFQGSASGQGSKASEGAGCVPAHLKTSVTALGQAFSVPAGWPAAITAEIKDDCGNPLVDGQVVASFSNGDPPLSLQSLKNGQWQGTWKTQAGSPAQVSVRVRASSAQGLQDEREVTVGLTGSQESPQLSPAGVVSAANPVSYVPLAPGGLISLYGDLLAEGSPQAATQTPLPETLGGASVLMAGRQLPLLYASATQINAMIPYDIETDTSHQILVRRGVTLSRPVPVNVALARPEFFATAEGRAIAAIVRGSDQISSLTSAARAGDIVVFYCAGLGAVDPGVTAGTAASLQTLSWTHNIVEVFFGDRSGTVQFAGLAPGFVGLYQVNVLVPDGVPVGERTPITLKVAGQTSSQANLAVE